MKGWTLVYKTPIHSRAEIVKGLLSDRDIEAVIVNKKDSTVHFSHGQVEVLVPDEQISNAENIVKNEITFR